MVSKLKRPEWFTKEKYQELKDQKIKDIEIQEKMLFVSRVVMTRFKKEAGIENKKGGSVRKFDYEKINKMHDEGFTYEEMMDELKCCRGTIHAALGGSRKLARYNAMKEDIKTALYELDILHKKVDPDEYSSIDSHFKRIISILNGEQNEF